MAVPLPGDTRATPLNGKATQHFVVSRYIYGESSLADLFENDA